MPQQAAAPPPPAFDPTQPFEVVSKTSTTKTAPSMTRPGQTIDVPANASAAEIRKAQIEAALGSDEDLNRSLMFAVQPAAPDAATALARHAAGSSVGQIVKQAAGALRGLGGAEAKYWGTKVLLETLHVPKWMAETAAVSVSNMGGKGAAPAAAEAEAAPEAATVAKPTGPVTPPTETPLAAQKATAPAPSSPPPAAAAGKIRLNADETAEFTRLSKRGVPVKDALGQIQAQREMVARQGLPTTAETKAAVAARNASGRWAADSTVGKGPVPPTSAITIDTPIGTAVQVNPKAPITLTLKSNGARLAFESKAALDEFLASRKGR